MVDYYQRNQAHFQPTDPPQPPGFLTAEYWEGRAERALEELRVGSAVRFLIFLKDDHSKVIGTISLTQIARGPFQAAFLGYGIDGQLQGRGLMTEALRAVIQYSFEQLQLHRLMANHLPENLASARILQKLDFEREGLAKSYLFINGRWRDHVLNALVNPAPQQMRT